MTDTGTRGKGEKECRKGETGGGKTQFGGKINKTY